MQTRRNRHIGAIAAHGAVCAASALFASPVLLLIGYGMTFAWLNG